MELVPILPCVCPVFVGTASFVRFRPTQKMCEREAITRENKVSNPSTLPSSHGPIGHVEAYYAFPSDCGSFCNECFIYESPLQY